MRTSTTASAPATGSCRRRRRRSTSRCGSSSCRSSSGATLVVAPAEAHKDPSWLARIIRDDRITTIHFVPSMLAVFLADAGRGRLVDRARLRQRRSAAGGAARPLSLGRRRRAAQPLRSDRGGRRRHVTGTRDRTTARRRCRSAGRSGTRRCTCSTRGAGRCRRGRPATSTSPASSWRASISAGRT